MGSSKELMLRGFMFHKYTTLATCAQLSIV